MNRSLFYEKNIIKYISNTNSKILVIGADTLDEEMFKKLGFSNVTYSNLNLNKNKDSNFLNLEMQNLSVESESFDYCVAHACVHHSSKPHNSILEMYRVAKKGVLVIEANDCFLVRLACKLKLAEEYEHSAIRKNKTHGGVDNTNINIIKIKVKDCCKK